MSLKKIVKRVLGGFKVSGAPTVRRSVILTVEGLEERWTPALFRWLGPAAGDPTGVWQDGRNWDNGAGTRYQFAQVPTNQDTVKFDGFETADCIVELGTEVAGSIQILPDFNRFIEINSLLKIDGGTSVLQHDGNNVRLYESGKWWFTGGTIAWWYGDINATFETGSVYLSDGAVLTVREGVAGVDRRIGGKDFNVGYRADDSWSWATMQLTDGTAGTNMLSDLSLQGSVKLWVSGGSGGNMSYLKLLDTDSVTTTGNIRKPASGNAVINNRGTLERDVPDVIPALTDPTTIEPPTWNEGTVLIGKGDRLQFTGSAPAAGGVNYSLHSEGTVTIRHNGHLYSTNTFYVTAGGVNVGFDPDNPANGKTGNVHGNMRMRGGSLTVNGSHTGTLQIWGDFVFGGSAVYVATIDVDNSSNDKVVEMDSSKAIALNQLPQDGARIQAYMRNSNAPVNQS